MNWRKLLPEIVEDWRDVISHHGSMWCLIAAFLLMLGNMLGVYFSFFEFDPYWVGWTVMLLITSAIWFKIKHQKGSRGGMRIRVVVVILMAMVLALLAVPRAFGDTVPEPIATATPLTQKWEGLRLQAYKPFSWDRWTICYGETHGVHAGMVRTKAECEAMLQSRMIQEWSVLLPYFTQDTVDNRLPSTRGAAYLDTAHNCGPVAIGKSTATRRLNAGNVPGGCQALTWWNKGGGRVLIGLVRRRSDDYQMCMVGA